MVGFWANGEAEIVKRFERGGGNGGRRCSARVGRWAYAVTQGQSRIVSKEMNHFLNEYRIYEGGDEWLWWHDMLLFFLLEIIKRMTRQFMDSQWCSVALVACSRIRNFFLGFQC